MPKEPRSPKESGPQTSPERFAETPPPQPHTFPSGDYSYILEIVMGMQNTMGKLTEAVESLKQQSSKHDEKLDDIGKDIHTAKTTLKVVGAILAAVMAFAGWVANKGIDAFVKLRQSPEQHQTIPPASQTK